MELDGKAVTAETMLHPRLDVVPMGWTWALWWRQRIHERLVVDVGGEEVNRLQDRRTAPALSAAVHLEYVDNFVVVSTDVDKVRGLAKRVVEEMRARGLFVKADCDEPEFDPGADRDVLGWRIECRRGRVRPTRARVWRARLAIQALLRRRRARGQELERLLGHITFISLIRREGLSVFNACYAFCRRYYEEEHDMWPSVRRELEMWDGLAPLLWRDLKAKWSDELHIVDASPSGLGACRADAKEEEVRSLGRVCERWRFHLCDGEGASHRAARIALQAAMEDQASSPATWLREAVTLQQEDGVADPQSAAALFGTGLEASSRFLEVPLNSRLSSAGGMSSVARSGSMPSQCLCLRVVQSCMGCGIPSGRSGTLDAELWCCMGDSLTAACAVAKGRSSWRAMLAVTQALPRFAWRLAPLCIVAGCRRSGTLLMVRREELRRRLH